MFTRHGAPMAKAKEKPWLWEQTLEDLAEKPRPS